MAKLYNRVAVLTATIGQGAITPGSALSGAFCTFAQAGAQDGDVVSYLITEGSDFEMGRGTYTAAGTTLSRDTVLLSKISGTAGTTKMTLAGGAEVRIVAAAEDIGWTRAAEQATTSGTAKDFTGIPPGVSEIVVSFNLVSLDGTGHLLVQLGDAGGIETAGYASASAGGVIAADGFVVTLGDAGVAASGVMTLYRQAGNKWRGSHGCRVGSGVSTGGGSKELSAELTQLRVTGTAGNFDNGAVSIMCK